VGYTEGAARDYRFEEKNRGLKRILGEKKKHWGAKQKKGGFLKLRNGGVEKNIAARIRVCRDRGERREKNRQRGEIPQLGRKKKKK